MQNKNDTIYRQAAIDALCNIGEHNSLGVEEIKKSLTVEPEQQNTRIFQGIVVEYPSISTYPEYEGKPYFSIKYTEDGQDFIGYGTYKPDILSEYLKKYFMPPAQPRMRGKWKEDKDCPNLAYLCSECGYFTTTRMDFCPGCGADMRLRGIYQPKYIEYICEYGDGR